MSASRESWLEPQDKRYEIECDDCQNGILNGEKYYHINGKNICERCMTEYVRYAEYEE